MGRRLALIIGVNSYQDASFQPLRYAENDARALAQWLVNTKGGNWSPPDVQHVQGAYATRELIESLITRLCVETAGPGDLVFIYFAGHAYVDATSGEGYLALANTTAQQPATAIHLPTLAQQSMGRSRAAHVVFLLDCFQNSYAWKARRSTPFDSKPLLGPVILNALQHIEDRFIVCSCRGNEAAPEMGEKNLGILAYRLILGLCGPASEPATKLITLQSLHSFLFQSLEEQQRPQLFGHERTPLVLVGEMPTSIPPVQAGRPSTSVLFSPNPTGQLSSSTNGAYAPIQTGQFSPAQSGPFAPVQTGSPIATFQQSPQSTPNTPFTQSTSPASLLTQTQSSFSNSGQLSSTTSGQLMLTETEQQSTMLLRQARHLVQMQNPAEAFNTVEQALQIMPTNVPALILKAQLLGSIGRSDEALFAVERAIQLEANNALAWSVRAALLTNTGHYQEALLAIEKSLELDPNNPETYSVKTNIMSHVASVQSNSKKLASVSKQRDNLSSFFLGALIQVGALLVGIAGSVLPILQPHIPLIVAFLLQSLGLAILCVNAARGSYLYGFFRFFLTLFISGVTAGILGAAALIGGLNKIGQGRVYVMVQNNASLLLPLLLCGAWLAVAAAIPLLLAFFGLIGGLVIGVRRKKS